MKYQKHHVKWHEMSNGQRMAVLLAAVVQIALLLAALRDIRHRDEGELRGGKALWTAISFINFVGPITYFALGRKPQGEMFQLNDE